LERKTMPNLRFGALTLIAAVLTTFSASANADNIFIAKDIAYGVDTLQKLDIYAPQGQKALKPVLIFIHGGGWQRGDKSSAEKHGTFYAEKGAVFVSINYRLSPKDKHPAQAEDSAAAVKWVYDNIHQYGGNKHSIHIAGHSAGAHLAALIATDGRYLAAHDLSPLLFKSVMPNDTASYDFSTPLVIGKRLVQPKIDATFGTTPQQIKAASPFSYVQDNKNLPPFICFVTGKRPDAVAQTHAFTAAIKTAGGQSETHIIDGLSHREMNQAMSDSASPLAQRVVKALWEQ
jgi:acetyl esterase/lipase